MKLNGTYKHLVCFDNVNVLKHILNTMKKDKRILLETSKYFYGNRRTRVYPKVSGLNR
jgi:hypothetical protein